jgi:hypothetical protein
VPAPAIGIGTAARLCWIIRLLKGRVSLALKHHILNPRHRSLLRGSALVLLSVAASLLLSHFPHNHPTPLIVLPALVAILGTFDTVRCMQRRWNFYHGGVLLCIYMDLMAVCLILFLLLYPYMLWMASSH